MITASRRISPTPVANSSVKGILRGACWLLLILCSFPGHPDVLFCRHASISEKWDFAFDQQCLQCSRRTLAVFRYAVNGVSLEPKQQNETPKLDLRHTEFNGFPKDCSFCLLPIFYRMPSCFKSRARQFQERRRLFLLAFLSSSSSYPAHRAPHNVAHNTFQNFRDTHAHALSAIKQEKFWREKLTVSLCWWLTEHWCIFCFFNLQKTQKVLSLTWKKNYTKWGTNDYCCTQ